MAGISAGDVLGLTMSCYKICRLATTLAERFTFDYKQHYLLTRELDSLRNNLTRAHPNLEKFGLLSTEILALSQGTISGKTSPRQHRLVSTWVAPAFIGSMPVQAIPDTCSDKNIMSKRMATKLCCVLNLKKRITMRLANNTTITSIGSVRLPIQFSHESETFSVRFYIFDDCAHDVILGKTFLETTETLTRFTHRLKKVVVKRLPGLNLAGPQRTYIKGTLNGSLTEAIADTGSDLMLISRRYAKIHGFEFEDKTDLDRPLVQFADGTVARTRGRVPNMEWSFEEDLLSAKHKVDFYVLDGLAYDVVLSNDFLFSLDAFNKYGSSFVDYAVPVEHSSDLCAIRLVTKLERWYDKKLEPWLRRRVGIQNTEVVPAAAVALVNYQEDLKHEMLRRDLERLRIHELEASQRRAALDAENQRQEQWRRDNPAPQLPQQ